MFANEQQVGGQHYKTAYEHWDLLLDYGRGIDYLIGQATKYVSRWRKKNGLQDLEKALHFVNKLIENKSNILFGKYSSPMVVGLLTTAVARYATANGLSAEEGNFCLLLIRMADPSDLYLARDTLVKIMEQVDSTIPVPLEDSNKHADRA